MRQKELDTKKFLYEILESLGYSVYADHQSPSINWFPRVFNCVQGTEKPDLLFFHQNLRYINPKDGIRTILPSPIGLEIKRSDSFKNLTTGISDQIRGRYKSKNYETKQDDHGGGAEWKGTIPLLGLTTDDALFKSHLYHCDHELINNEDQAFGIDFALCRMLWREENCALLRYKQYLALSFQDYYHAESHQIVVDDGIIKHPCFGQLILLGEVFDGD